MNRAIEKEAAEALLDRGVSVPFKDIRLPFRKKPLKVRITMKRPTLAGQIEIGRQYLEMDTTAEEAMKLSKMEQMRFMARHGKRLSRILAYTVCRGYISRHLLVGLTAWLVRHFVEYRYQLAAAGQFERLMGTGPFMSIIRSAERTNPMKPRLSQGKKGS